MDPLHLKVGADLCLMAEISEDAFYERNSCDWLQFLRWMKAAIWQVAAQGRYAAKDTVDPIEP